MRLFRQQHGAQIEMAKKLKDKQAAKKRTIGLFDRNVKIRNVSMRTVNYVLKRDAKALAALAKCDTRD